MPVDDSGKKQVYPETKEKSKLLWSLFLFFFFFLDLHMWHMEIPNLGVKSELQLPGYTTATATTTWDPSHACDLYHSLWHH